MPGTPRVGEGGATTVLWDLDGTLVGIRQRTFSALMPLLAAKAFRDVIPPWRFLHAMNEVLPQVRSNSSDTTNHDLLVSLLAEQAGIDVDVADARMRRLAGVEFPKLRRCFHPVPQMQRIVAALAERDVRQVVATNPLWPLESVTIRLGWGGLDPKTFAHITSGESMRRSKPNIEYYSDLVELLGVKPEQCVMIGNDLEKDPPATALGIPVFLLRPTGGPDPAPTFGGNVDPSLVTIGGQDQLAPWLGLEEAPCSSS